MCFLDKTFRQVMYIPANNAKWFKTTDHLAGTYEVGIEGDDSEWAIKFSTSSKYLFMTGD
jgi:hypothetical protein